MSEEYSAYEADKAIDLDNIDIRIGLNNIENITPSPYFYEALRDSRYYSELEPKLYKYYSHEHLDVNLS